MNVVNVDGNMATPDAIRRTISGVKPDKNDTVVFYYSGHAGNAGADGGQFFHLKDEKEITTNELTRANVRDLLCQNNPRLVVLLTDCCNVFAPRGDKEIFLYNSRGNAAPSDFTPVMKTLFIEPRGVIDVTSSKVGQYSYATESGSIATLSWIQVFNEINSSLKENPSAKKSWRDALQEITVASDTIFKKEYPNGSPEGQKTQIPHVYESPGLPRFGVRVVTLEFGNVKVDFVAPDSPGAKAGIKSGDIITAINGETILDEPEYSTAIDKAPRQTNVRFKRDGKENSVDVELCGIPIPEPAGTPNNPTNNSDPNSTGNATPDPRVYGPQNQQTNNSQNQQADAQQTTASRQSAPSGPVFGASVQGNKIVNIVAGSPAANVGLEVNDLLLKINGADIKSAEDFAKAVDASGTTASLEIRDYRTGQIKTINIQLNK